MSRPASPMPSPGGQSGRPALFDRATAAEVLEQTRYVRNVVRGGAPSSGVPPRGGVVPAYVAKLTTDAGPRSGTGYGTGTAQIQKDTGTLSDDSDFATVQVKNLVDKTIASGSYVFVVWASGSWWVTTPDSCDHVT